MFDAELIQNIVQQSRAAGCDAGTPQRIELVAVGFPDLAAAETFSRAMEELGFTPSVREEAPIPIEILAEELRTAGLAYDPTSEEMRPALSWRVVGKSEIAVDVDTLMKLQPLDAAARHAGGFVSVLAFPG